MPDAQNNEEHVMAKAGAAAVANTANGPGDEQPDRPPFQVESAFLVYMDQTGHWAADSNVGADGSWVVDDQHPSIQVGRPATFNDMFHAAADITKDLTAIEAASRTVQAQQQVAAQMAQQVAAQRENAAIAARLGDITGGPKIPGGAKLLGGR